MSDHYITLQIHRSASNGVIRASYKALASLHHPDRGGDTLLMQKINDAYAILSDPMKKRQYDESLNASHFDKEFFKQNAEEKETFTRKTTIKPNAACDFDAFKPTKSYKAYDMYFYLITRAMIFYVMFMFGYFLAKRIIHAIH